MTTTSTKLSNPTVADRGGTVARHGQCGSAIDRGGAVYLLRSSHGQTATLRSSERGGSVANTVPPRSQDQGTLESRRRPAPAKTLHQRSDQAGIDMPEWHTGATA